MSSTRRSIGHSVQAPHRALNEASRTMRWYASVDEGYSRYPEKRDMVPSLNPLQRSSPQHPAALSELTGSAQAPRKTSASSLREKAAHRRASFYHGVGERPPMLRHSRSSIIHERDFQRGSRVISAAPMSASTSASGVRRASSSTISRHERQIPSVSRK